MEFAKVLAQNDAAYDEAVNAGLPDDGKPVFISKSNATKKGLPAVVITFQVEVDGEIKRAQTVLTVRTFLNIAAALKGAHEHELNQ